MTFDELANMLRPFVRRRPFRPFVVEFMNGTEMLVTHPEAIRPLRGVFVYIGPDGRYVLFAASSVCRLLDPPAGVG